MPCKYDNAMYTTIPKETDEYGWFDIDELVEEPVEEFDNEFAEENLKEFKHLQFLISEYHDSDE